MAPRTALVATLLAGLGVSTEAGAYAKDFVKYYDYTGDLSVSGVAIIGEWHLTNGTALNLWWNVTGADPMCTAPTDAANSCGIHVHSGMNCSENANGHYYDDATMSTDPWLTFVYTAEDTGSSVEMNNYIVANKGISDIVGRTFIVHDQTGARVACAIIMEDEATDMTKTIGGTMAKYPDSDSDLSPAGTVTAVFTADQMGGTSGAVSIKYDLTGLDPDCADGDGVMELESASNACGLHFHSGNCSSQDTVGGHYYDATMLSSDPWAKVIYGADDTGATGSGISVLVPMGVSIDDLASRSIVVHAATGGRIGCADVTITEDATTTTTTTTTTVVAAAGAFRATLASGALLSLMVTLLN